jgi:hypothetical protein
MPFFDLFALIVLAVLLIAAVVAIGLLGALPGRIARNRGHPQADAISVGGWLSLLFGGVLWPVMMIWAYTRYAGHQVSANSADKQGQEGGK